MNRTILDIQRRCNAVQGFRVKYILSAFKVYSHSVKSKKRRFGEDIQIRRRSKMTYPKFCWPVSYPGKNFRLFSKCIVLIIDNGTMPTIEYGQLWSQLWPHLFALMLEISRYFENRKKRWE